MNDLQDKEQLLADLLVDDQPTGWREQSLARAIAASRRRRWKRRVQFSAAVVVVLFLALVAFVPSPAPAPRKQAVQNRAYEVVHSSALPANMIVHSQPGALSIVHSSPTSVAIVHTDPDSTFVARIGDGQLLDLAGRGAMLVRDFAGRTRLVMSEALNAVWPADDAVLHN